MAGADKTWTPFHRASRHVVVVLGPTAVGKSELAVQLAAGIGGEIINADAYQLYRGMDIGTAKPTAEQRAAVPHHLLDVLDVAQAASVATFQRQARDVIADCHRRMVTPVVVGGSSLYVRAVIDPLDFPGTDPAVRAGWQSELDRVGTPALHQQLAAVDPAAAAKILPSNGRRIVRALEVIELTSKPFAASMPDHQAIYRHVTMIGLDADRLALDERVAARVDQMWDAGLVGEVKRLVPLGLATSPTASRAIGYQQALAYLDGELSEAQARGEMVAATRKFARRQLRLFGRDPRIHWM